MAKIDNKYLLGIYYRMACGENVVENFKSEKTAKSVYNKVVEFENTIHFRLTNIIIGDKERRDQFKDDLEERFMYPYQELIKMGEAIYPMINKRRLADCLSTKDYNMYLKSHPDYQGYPHYTIAFGKRGDGGRIETQFGTFTANCVEETHTSKRATKKDWQAVFGKIMDYYGVYDDLNLPSYVKLYGNYNTEEQIKVNIGQMEEILKNGDPKMGPASEKQIYWIAKKMGCTPESASRLNKFQASELLGELFKEDWHEDEGLLNFYRQKLSPVTESKKNINIVMSESQVNRLFLTENRESKNMSIARDVVRKFNSNINPQRILDAVRTDIPSSRLNNCEYLPGVVRMSLSGQLRDHVTIAGLNNSLKILATAHAHEYNKDLNGMPAQEIIDRFKSAVRGDVEAKKEANSQKQFGGNTRYKVVKIPDFEEASNYSEYVTWCVTHDERMFENYTHGGMGVFYFLLRDDWMEVPKKEGENCPLDDYGLSMIAVSVNEDGSLNTVTCRWNHANGGNDNIMNDEQLSNLLGQDVYQVLKPINIEILGDNKRFRTFKKDGITWMFDKKMDVYKRFDQSGYATYQENFGSSLHGKVNIKGEIAIKAKYFDIFDLESDGCFMAVKYGSGLVKQNGEEIFFTEQGSPVHRISGATPLGTRLYYEGSPSAKYTAGLINVRLGRQIKPGTYEKIEYMEEDMRFRATDEDGNIVLINEDLTVATDPNKFPWIDCVETISGEPTRVVVDNNDKYGLIDKDLNFILPCEYDYISEPIDNEKIKVRKGDRKSGNLQVWFLYYIDGKFKLINK